VGGTLRVGTSGFAYKEWKGPFYPAGLPDRAMLGHYATRFPTVEINYTFRRQPSPTTLEGWREQTPEGFSFGLKAHQRITHTLRLADADEAVSRFLEAVRALGDRLGPILFQCPPNLPFDRRRIESFLAYLPPTFRYAMEFRHPSWEEAKPILAGQGVAWCAAETDEASVAEFPTEPFVYLRLRKTEYQDEELASWAKRIRPIVGSGTDVYAYLKHEDKGAGPIWAERLRDLVDGG
jgi:uncharacterized protein YecE (DUF72 family)